MTTQNRILQNMSKKKQQKFCRELLPHPPYAIDLATLPIITCCDSLSNHMGGRKFDDEDHLKMYLFGLFRFSSSRSSTLRVSMIYPDVGLKSQILMRNICTMVFGFVKKKFLKNFYELKENLCFFIPFTMRLKKYWATIY